MNTLSFSTLKCGDRILDLSEPTIMGILNLTEDSFYSKSRVLEKDLLLRTAGKMVEDGARILDLGGMSTRPGAAEISESEESDRVQFALELLADKFPEVVFSVDTYRAKVFQKAFESGATILNDISGFEFDPELLSTLKASNLPYILMHNKAKSSSMIKAAKYENLIEDMIDYFYQKIDVLEQNGIYDVIIDPGFGFSKTIKHNFEIAKRFETFQQFGKPLLAGISRKSMIHRTLGIDPDQGLNGTTALHMYLLEKGCNILRVHDVREAAEVISLWKELTKR